MNSPAQGIVVAVNVEGIAAAVNILRISFIFPLYKQMIFSGMGFQFLFLSLVNLEN